MCFLFPKRNLC